MHAVRAELRKLLTVRSTYIIVIGSFLLNVGIIFWTSGYKTTADIGPTYLQDTALSAVGGIGFFAGLIPILLISHEYRHNLIFYTFTANRSRTSVFLAKLVVIVVYALLFMLLHLFGTLAATAAGLQLGNHAMGTQAIDWWPLLWRGGFYTIAISLLGAIFAFIVRNQIGAFVTYLLYPGTVESLLGLVLKNKTMYMPYNSINNVIMTNPHGLSLHKTTLIATLWLLFGLAVSWALFLRRDAN